MNVRRLGSICAVSSIAVLAGCGSPSGETTDETSSASSISIPVPIPIPMPIPVPTASVWQPGFTATGIVAGLDIDNTPLYACRATLSVNGLPTPGKTRHDWNWCAVSYGGRVYLETSYATLTPEWIPEQGGVVPSNALATGNQNGEALYTCRAAFGESLEVGRTGAGIAGCSIPFEGLEIVVTSYQVLSTPNAQFGLLQMNAGETMGYDTLQAGNDASGDAVYPCSISYEGSLMPGQTKAGWGYCQVAFNGKAQAAGTAYTVITPSIGSKNGPSFLAGTDTGGGALGICTTPYAGSSQVGKYIESQGLCDFPFGTSEIATTQFSVFESTEE